MLMLVMHLFWHVNIRPYRTSSDICNKINVFCMVALFVQVSYFLMIEIMQARADFEGYVKDIVWNVVDTSPLMTIYFQIVLAILFEEQ